MADETTTKEWTVNHEPTNEDHESQRNASNYDNHTTVQGQFANQDKHLSAR